ncbi:acetyltransferase [Xylariales sp. AK1849]|nr:acetyltransferase [Xylariales sp. AK1849]
MSSNKNLKVLQATEADARRAVEIEAIAYGPNPFGKILFPGPFPDNAGDMRADGLVKSFKEDSTQRWLKVVDLELPEGEEQMIAFAKWHIYTEAPTLTTREFGQGCNIEACEKLFGGLQDQRKKIMGGRTYAYLHLLQTDPKHQRRGAGSQLILWGIMEAERLGLVAYLESSESGHSLYHKMGFKDVELHEVDLSSWGAEETHKTWAMICDPTDG